MTEIPEDVMKAAREADEEFLAQNVPSGTENTVSFYAARAILAERERCARIADRNDMSAWGIAREIRSVDK